MKHIKFGMGQTFEYTDTQNKTHRWEVTQIRDEGKMCRAKCVEGGPEFIPRCESGFIIEDGKIIN